MSDIEMIRANVAKWGEIARAGKFIPDDEVRETLAAIDRLHGTLKFVTAETVSYPRLSDAEAVSHLGNIAAEFHDEMGGS